MATKDTALYALSGACQVIKVVHGEALNPQVAEQVADVVQDLPLDGVFYIGYPVLTSAEEQIDVEGLLLTEQHGLLALTLEAEPPATTDQATWDRLADRQDRLAYALESNLGRYDSLRERRKLAIAVNTAMVFPVHPQVPDGLDGNYTGLAELGALIQSLEPIADHYRAALRAALQRVSTIKPAKKRASVSRSDSKAARLKLIEAEIANLDQWQQTAAIETPDSPQRVRGLAGSGKTVVLALKAAYLHAQHPDWTIAVTFQSRALYQQFGDLIDRFSFAHSNDKPNPAKLRLLHSWGGTERGGVYTQIAQAWDAPVRDFQYAMTRYGRRTPFAGVCAELLNDVPPGRRRKIYDAVLIDEAQDLPPEFLQLVYEATRDPKRIVWAYDELQNLSDAAMPSTADLFGYKEDRTARVVLRNPEHGPSDDIILPICYRNTPWALSMAHALGFGIYRDGTGILQHFDNPQLWKDIGYRVVDGILALGSHVILERDPNATPSYFRQQMTSDEAVQYYGFASEDEQANWIAKAVRKNLDEDELDCDDILIVLPDAYTAKPRATTIMRALAAHNIDSHLAGVDSSRDQLFMGDSVALANIFRSKGNEAPMVYVANSQFCYSGIDLVRKRNTIFTAITRSRAWVRVCGWGDEMALLRDEMNKVTKSAYKLVFTIPTQDELERMRMINRDTSAAERDRAHKAERALEDVLAAFAQGDIRPDMLSESVRTAMTRLLTESRVDSDADGQ